MNRIIAAAAAGALAVLALAGCASGGHAAAASPTPTKTSVKYATQQQVASVIAAQAPTWQETIDAAGQCRATWTFSPGAIDGLTCQTREETIGLTAGNVVSEWNKLNVPPSMEGIVSDTTSILTKIADTNPDDSCGTSWDTANTDTCNSALATRNFLYTQLSTQLDAWSPYL